MATVPDIAVDADAAPSLLARYVTPLRGGRVSAQLIVPGMHCAGCLVKTERALKKGTGEVEARASLSTKRIRVSWQAGAITLEALIDRLGAVGFEASPFNQDLVASADKRRERELLRAMAVAGFAAANVMLLSIAVWAGIDMEVETRTLMHWLSALIVIPAVAYAGRPFFRSARGALARRQLNMDVPISLAVILATGASVMEAVRGGEHVYFDAAASLLFFLLIGRFLDVRMRAKAGAVARNLLGLRAGAVTVLDGAGATRLVPVDQVEIGMTARVATGMRFPVDGVVRDGVSDIDTSLITGETLPRRAEPGDRIYAGTVNLSAPLTVQVTATDAGSLLAEIVRLMESAEQGRDRFIRLADRFARIYAPAVHLLALATFLGWMVAGWGWHPALMAAVAVLIITCPCALGLAVPVVQVTAVGRLLRHGVLVKSGDALERLSTIDTVVFDKTGTLTTGRLTLTNRDEVPDDALALGAALAASSRHPLSRALLAAADEVAPLPLAPLPLADLAEVPGCGLSATLGGEAVRLGRADWVGADDGPDDHLGPVLWLRRGPGAPVRFTFADRLRPGAAETIDALKAQGMDVHLLSGDRPGSARGVAEQLGIDQWRAQCSPADKIAALDSLKAAGRRIAMVGDGLNDAPALQAAQVSLSPADAADISQTAADFVMQGDDLSVLLEALAVSRRARRLAIGNFAIALGYNTIAVPLAVAGFATPLVAAIAMSTSSLTVTINALRLNWGGAAR